MTSPRPWTIEGSSTTVRIVDWDGKTVLTMKAGENDLANAELIIERINKEGKA